MSAIYSVILTGSISTPHTLNKTSIHQQKIFKMVNGKFIWKCSICILFFAVTLKDLVRHITIQHAGQPNFSVKCGISGCPEKYTKMNSFRKHLRNRHKDELDLDHEENSEEVTSFNANLSDDTSNGDDEFDSQVNGNPSTQSCFSSDSDDDEDQDQQDQVDGLVRVSC